MKVLISKRGRTYHKREDCPWWVNARAFSEERGWHVYPAEKVTVAEAEQKRRHPCRICVGYPEKENVS